MSLADLKNLGPKTREWLIAIGIENRADLEALGSIEAYRRLKAAFPHKVSLNALWALEAALLDIDWRAINPDHKSYLREKLAEGDK